MTFEWDPILFMNLTLCIIIVILGWLCTKRSGEPLPMYIGCAFGLFGISHAATLSGYKDLLVIPLIIIRLAAYILVIIALYLFLKKTLIAKDVQQAWVDFYHEDTKPDT